MIKLIVFNAISVLVLVLIIGATTSLSIQWAASLSVIITLVVDYLVIDYLVISKLEPRNKKRDFSPNWQKVGERWDGK